MPRPSKKKSVVWNHFTLEADKKYVTCNTCKKIYKFFGNTTNLKEHLKRIHPLIQLQNEQNIFAHESEDASVPSTSSINAPPPTNASEPSTIPSQETIIPPPPKRKRQIRLTTREDQTQLTDKQIRDIDKSVVKMIVNDYQPMSIVEDSGFKGLCKKLNPNYALPSRKTLTTKLIPEHYNIIHSKVVEDLKHVDHISATTDYWQSEVIHKFNCLLHS